MSRKEDAYLTCLPTSRLWEAYSLEDRLLTEVKLHLIKTGWLSEQGKWCDFDGETVDRERFTIWDEDDGENNSLVFFSRLFGVVLGFLQRSGRMTHVKEMVCASSIELRSTDATDPLSDAFL